ncbi:MAG: 4-hydroxy-tetrahydrodipicolinate synthase [Halobacteriota archaeon]|nr:4-hydroxy-tetrahydrodipicolinate synthase [Halobacteriota archaeon]
MLEGVFAAIVTPFMPDGTIDEEGVKRNIEFVIEGGVTGIVPCGSTGESATLSHAEHKKLIDIAVDVSSVPVLAGTGSNNTWEAVGLTKYAEDAGAQAAMLITPYYNKPNRSGLIKHFTEAAKGVDIPIVLYNVPSRTGLNMTPDVVLELSRVGNIVGIKEASSNHSQITSIIDQTDDDFTLLSGNDDETITIMSLGGKGVISVAANVVPGEMRSLVDALKDSDLKSAREIHYKLLPLFKALFIETNPIPVKKATELMGLSSGRLRLPLGPMSDENEKTLSNVLRSMNIV